MSLAPVDGRPSHLEECAEGMSNFDHRIDEGFEEKLRTGEFWGSHTAWNFYGEVWFENDKFHEQIWVYRFPREVISANTLKELRDAVNDSYGSE